MISGNRDERCVVGTFVLPTEDGNYACPPAPVIETFWAYKRKCCTLCRGVKKVSYGGELGWIEPCPECRGAGKIILTDSTDMVLMYKFVDSVTVEVIPFQDGEIAKDVTLQMIVDWVSTRKHPHFI